MKSPYEKQLNQKLKNLENKMDKILYYVEYQESLLFDIINIIEEIDVVYEEVEEDEDGQRIIYKPIEDLPPQQESDNHET